MSRKLEVVEASANSIQMRCCRFGHGAYTMTILPGITPGHVTDSADAVVEEVDCV